MELQLTFAPFTLELRDVFTIAGSSRATTPVVLTELRWNDRLGYGEASLPPYLGETQASVAAFFGKVDLSRFDDPFRMEEILAYVDQVAPGNTAAKAAIDIALHDLVGQALGQPWWRIWGLDRDKSRPTSFTIGIDTPEVVRRKTAAASAFGLLKVKLGRANDREIIEAIRSVTPTPICVDANQGWHDRDEALTMIHWLAERDVVMVEQPMPKDRFDDMAWLTARSPLPTIADEAVQGLADVRRAVGAYSGINIKLMKCGGLRTAQQMLHAARALDLQVMLGCMTETSCAIAAAAQLAPAVDWVDLDGALLIANDPYEGATLEGGRILPAFRSGIGVRKIDRPS